MPPHPPARARRRPRRRAGSPSRPARAPAPGTTPSAAPAGLSRRAPAGPARRGGAPPRRARREHRRRRRRPSTGFVRRRRRAFEPGLERDEAVRADRRATRSPSASTCPRAECGAASRRPVLARSTRAGRIRPDETRRPHRRRPVRHARPRLPTPTAWPTSVDAVAAIVMPEHLRSTGTGADRRAFIDVADRARGLRRRVVRTRPGLRHDAAQRRGRHRLAARPRRRGRRRRRDDLARRCVRRGATRTRSPTTSAARSCRSRSRRATAAPADSTVLVGRRR